MSDKEDFSKIFDLIFSVVVFRNQTGIITENEIREMTKRIFEYRDGPELYSVVMAISNERYFPSAHELESRIRVAKGIKPLKGLTEDLIKKNERELVVSGSPPPQAAIGAEIMRKTLRKSENASPDTLLDHIGPTGFEGIPLKPEAPVTKLEIFDELTTKVLEELEDF